MAKLIKALVVGGGAGAYYLGSKGHIGGGGGAGTLLHDPAFVLPSTSVTVIVGGGGAAGGVAGSNSSVSTLIAEGGVPTTGGYRDTHGSYIGTCYYAGPGAGGPRATSNNGGPAAINPIAGSTAGFLSGGNYYLAAGGSNQHGTSVLGATSLGSGGNNSTSGQQAGKAGVVVISYTTTHYGKCTGGTITTSGDQTIHTFTSSGTFTVTYTTTQEVTNISFDNATAHGHAYSGGGPVIVDRGFVFSASSTSPTLSDRNVTLSGSTGAYSTQLTDLDLDTTYYVRSFIRDAEGLVTYGEETRTFTTLAVPSNTLVKDINGVEGQTYAVRLYVGGTTGTLTVKIGSEGHTETFAAGAGYVTLEGVYGGVNGLMFEADGFDGYIDDVQWVLILGNATIDWSSDILSNMFPINSQVLFKRMSDEEFNRFRIYRILDIQFKDLDAFVTVQLKNEANEKVSTASKEFLVHNEEGEALPFINKRLSMLTKDQGIRIGMSNNRLSETFTVCQLVLKGTEQQDRLFSGGKIIDINT